MACAGSQSCRKDGCRHDDNDWRRSDGRPPAEKESVPTVVFIGRLSANKRPDHAIRAFGYVRGQLPEAQMWVIGSGPEEARLRKMAGPGVTFFGRVTEEEKRQRLGRAHALVATSVREGWGLVVTEAAANGTVSIGYDVAGLRDSIGASGGILTRANPASLATGLARLLSSVGAGDVYLARPAGVVPWTEVADGILSVARESESPATQVLGKAGTRGRHRAAGVCQRLFRVRVGLGVLGVALLFPLGSTRDLGLSQILAGSAFLALLAATLIGSVEGLSTRRGHNQLQADGAVGTTGRWHVAIANRPGHRRAYHLRRYAILVRSGSAARRRRPLASSGHCLAGTALRSLVVVWLKSRWPSL